MVGVMRKLWVMGGLLALLTACATARSSTPPETGGDSGSIPSLSDLGPHFPDGELAAAVSAFRGGRNGEAAEVFEGFLENRSEDPRRLPTEEGPEIRDRFLLTGGGENQRGSVTLESTIIYSGLVLLFGIGRQLP